MSSSMGLYSSGMHDFILREAEIGTRATMAEDDEACGWSALLDLQYMEYTRCQDEKVHLDGMYVI